MVNFTFQLAWVEQYSGMRQNINYGCVSKRDYHWHQYNESRKSDLPSVGLDSEKCRGKYFLSFGIHDYVS